MNEYQAKPAQSKLFLQHDDLHIDNNKDCQQKGWVDLYKPQLDNL